MRRWLAALLALVVGTVAVWIYRLGFWSSRLPPGPRTTEQVLAAVGKTNDRRLRGCFARAGLSYPPAQLTVLVLKREMRLEIYAPTAGGKQVFVHSWPVLAASGSAGPKRREGDRQVPEGFYRVVLLNPNSRFHLSLRLDYPNEDDLARAREEGRDFATLGGDIMIHGNAVSTGCVAIGDRAAEELFCLVSRVGLENVQVIISPVDWRILSPPTTSDPLNLRLREALGSFPRYSSGLRLYQVDY